jgi:hypothetical protein
VNLQRLRALPGVLVAATLIAAGASLAEETHDFARYEIIIKRSPFGPVPGTQSASSAQPSFATRFVLVGLVQSNGEDGVVQIIIEDKQAHRTYFRAEGEAMDDVTVLHIEVQPPQSVVLQRVLETATLTFSEQASATASAPKSGPQPGPALPPVPGAAVVPVPRRIPFQRGN